jgi:hypothetical protein
VPLARTERLFSTFAIRDADNVETANEFKMRLLQAVMRRERKCGRCDAADEPLRILQRPEKFFG